MPKKRSKKRLPRKIIPIENPDKTWHEKWDKNRDPLNIPHPYSGVLIGLRNTGKGTIAKNIILRANPPFKRIYVVHVDAHYTNEWEDVDGIMLDTIPDPTDEIFNSREKTLMIFDDMEFKSMNKKQIAKFDRINGYAVSHKHLSTLVLSQDAFNIPSSIRRLATLWVLWKIDDIDSLYAVARKTGLKKEEYTYLFNNYLKEFHDSLWIDKTEKTPYPLRINGYDIINKKSEQ